MWCSRAGRRRVTWKLFDLLVNCTDGVIYMLKYVGTGSDVGVGSEVTREIWEMKLLMLLPRLELGSSGTTGENADRVIWEPVSVRVCGTCCFGRWLQSLFSTLLQLDVRSQSLCGLWFASIASFPVTGAQLLCWLILGLMCTTFCGSPQRSSWFFFVGHRNASPVIFC